MRGSGGVVETNVDRAIFVLGGIAALALVGVIVLAVTGRGDATTIEALIGVIPVTAAGIAGLVGLRSTRPEPPPPEAPEEAIQQEVERQIAAQRLR